MIVIALTGSIGMGKSSAASMLRRMGLPVHDSDATVRRLLGAGGKAVEAVAEAFPQARAGGQIDRKILGDLVFKNKTSLKRLEAILHPLVRKSRDAFLRRAMRDHAPLAILDIPLLYESGADAAVDAVIVVSAPPLIQRERVLARAGMDEKKFRAILERQMPDTEKRSRADYIVDTGSSFAETERQLEKALKAIRRKAKTKKT